MIVRHLRNRDRRQDRRGAAVVEMALVLPIFFMVVLGIIEFGRAFMIGQLVTNAAREAVRPSEKKPGARSSGALQQNEIVPPEATCRAVPRA